MGVAWRLAPQRLPALPALLGLHLNQWVFPTLDLPDPEITLRRAPNVAGIAHDLSVATLVEAYSRGLYPLSHVLKPKWLSPPERCVLFYRDLHISKRFRPIIRSGRFRVTFDRAFDQVIQACAEPRGKRLHLTWIRPRIMRAYDALHRAGHAHSFEVWNGSGELVGGGYGVSVGRTFSLESMFAFEDNSSKVGFTVLNWHLAHWGFPFTDNKGVAPYKLQLGFRVIPRSDFLAMHRRAVALEGRHGSWNVEADLGTVATWHPEREQPAEPA